MVGLLFTPAKLTYYLQSLFHSQIGFQLIKKGYLEENRKTLQMNWSNSQNIVTSFRNVTFRSRARILDNGALIRQKPEVFTFGTNPRATWHMWQSRYIWPNIKKNDQPKANDYYLNEESDPPRSVVGIRDMFFRVVLNFRVSEENLLWIVLVKNTWSLFSHNENLFFQI